MTESDDQRRMARVYSEQAWNIYDFLDESEQLRGPEWLVDLARGYLHPGAVVLDAGCRDGRGLIELVRGLDVTGVGVDPVAVHVRRGDAAVVEAGLGDRISLVEGVMQSLPYPDDHFDLIWCRDVVEQVTRLEPAMREAVRVLKPTGRMVVFTVFTTDLLEPNEADMISRHLGNVPANLVEANVEATFDAVGLTQERREVIGTEWREYAEERTHPVSRALLRLSRLRRQRAAAVERFGEELCGHVEANLHWEIYQFLGKLRPTAYVLGKRPTE